MSEYNPYNPPSETIDPSEGTDAVIQPNELVLASRLQRFTAFVLDSIVQSVVLLPIFFATVFYLFQNQNMESLEGLTSQINDTWLIGVNFGFKLFTFLAWLAINGYLLKKYGQTIGKRIMSIKIVKEDGSQATLADLAGLRYGFFTFIQMIPLIGGLLTLVNICFIFGAEQKCVHDHIARTRVITA